MRTQQLLLLSVLINLSFLWVRSTPQKIDLLHELCRSNFFLSSFVLQNILSIHLLSLQNYRPSRKLLLLLHLLLWNQTHVLTLLWCQREEIIEIHFLKRYFLLPRKPLLRVLIFILSKKSLLRNFHVLVSCHWSFHKNLLMFQHPRKNPLEIKKWALRLFLVRNIQEKHLIIDITGDYMFKWGFIEYEN